MGGQSLPSECWGITVTPRNALRIPPLSTRACAGARYLVARRASLSDQSGVGARWDVVTYEGKLPQERARFLRESVP